MDLENSMLSEINQTQRTKRVALHLHEVPRIRKFIETESRLEVTGAGKRGERGVVV